MKKTGFFKIISLLTAALLIFCSCGKNAQPDSEMQSVTNPHESNESFKVAILQYDNDYCSAQMRQAFIARMRTLGYDEAKMKFDVLSAQSDFEKLTDNAESLLNSDYSLIIALGTLAAKAVAATENTIPCVFIGVQDPVGNGFVSDISSPDKNMTGTAFRSSNETLLAIIRVYISELKSIALLGFEDNEFTKADIASLKSALEEGAYGVEVCEFSQGDGISAKIIEICQSVDALYIPSDERFEKEYEDIIRIATENGKLVFSTSESAINQGALWGAFTSAEKLATNAALAADKVMQGEQISKIPVDIETDISLFVNRQTANNMKIEIPKSDNLILV